MGRTILLGSGKGNAFIHPMNQKAKRCFVFEERLVPDGMEDRLCRRRFMNIALILPPVGPARGNRTTVLRWARGMESLGHEVNCAEPSECSRIRRADLVHGHHALHTGLSAVALGQCFSAPVVISLGGTELYDERENAAAQSMGEIFRQVQGVLIPHEAQADRLRQLVESIPPTFVVPRGVKSSSQGKSHLSPSGFRVLMIGAIRPVKGQLEVLRVLAGIRDLPTGFSLLIRGAVADSDYGQKVSHLASQLDFVEIEEPISSTGMEAVYARSHALLNYSHHEGASNAILEAWAAGLPLAASDVPGNRELLRGAPDAVARLLRPGDRDALSAWFEELSLDSLGKHESRSRQARAYVQERHSLEQEMEALLRAYTDTLLRSEVGE